MTSNWTWGDCQVFVKELRLVALGAGYAVALAGSVLYRGESKKDLDIVLFPLGGTDRDLDRLKAALKSYGMVLELAEAEVKAQWLRDYDSRDTKHVEIWKAPDGRRVDLFFLS